MLGIGFDMRDMEERRKKRGKSKQEKNVWLEGKKSARKVEELK